MNRKFANLIGCAGGVFALVGANGCRETQAKNNLPRMDIAEVQTMDLSRKTRVTGPIRGATRTSLRAEIGGKITKVLVEPGDKVAAGQVLLTIESEAQKKTHVDLEHQVKLAKLKVEKESAKLARIGSEDKEAKERELDIKIAEEELAAIQSRLENHTRLLDKGVVRATSPGRVASVDVSEGDVVTGSSEYTIGSQLLQLNSADSFLVDVSYGERELAFLRKGAKVLVQFPAAAHQPVEGQISRISEAARFEDHTPVFTVTVAFTVSDPDIKLGMTATVETVLERHPTALVVPIDCVGYVGEKTYVQVYSTASAPPQEVTLGIVTPEYAEILDGVASSARVIRNFNRL